MDPCSDKGVCGGAVGDDSVHKARGDMGAWPVVRMEVSRGFSWRLSNTRVGYRTLKDRSPTPRERCVYSVFCATRGGEPRNSEDEAFHGLGHFVYLGGSEGEGFSAV